MLREDFNESEIDSIYKVLYDMPTVRVDLSLGGGDSDGGDRQIVQPPTPDSWLRVQSSTEYRLCVNLTRIGKRSSKCIHCPKFPKGKDEGWIIMLGNQYDGELYALKRIGAQRNNRSTHQLTFVTPTRSGRYIYTMYLMSDGYIGFDQQFDIQFEVMAIEHP